MVEGLETEDAIAFTEERVDAAGDKAIAHHLARKQGGRIVHDKLVVAGFTIEKKRIHLHTPVKTLGKHTVKVKLHADVSVELGFDVVSENPIDVPAPETKSAAKGDKK